MCRVDAPENMVLYIKTVIFQSYYARTSCYGIYHAGAFNLCERLCVCPLCCVSYAYNERKWAGSMLLLSHFGYPISVQSVLSRKRITAKIVCIRTRPLNRRNTGAISGEFRQYDHAMGAHEEKKRDNIPCAHNRKGCNRHATEIIGYASPRYRANKFTEQ